MSVSIAQLTAEHHHDGFSLFTATPRLSWRFNATKARGWRQASYDIVVSRGGRDERYHVDSAQSVLVNWPSSPLASRERVQVKVRSTGEDGSQTGWTGMTIEVALLEQSDWVAKMISCPPQDNDKPKRPFRLRTTFEYSGSEQARLYATAHGLYEVEINGKRVGDHVLAPGWQSYQHRLHYQVFDITPLVRQGGNVITVYVAEGWFAGRLGRPGVSNIWGERVGFLGQVEVGGKVACVTSSAWEYLDGPLILSEIYNGEVFDTTLSDGYGSDAAKESLPGRKAEELPFPTAQLISPDVAPVRRVMEVKPKELLTTPSGKNVLDFGQNLVGWLRIEKDIRGKQGDELLIRHAEVMEHGELGARPLRTAMARDIVKLGGSTKGHEPRFTFHGFRYAEISGYDNISLDDFTAIVISSDLRRTGTFESSHALVNKLHENTVWSMRGNFVSVPTDCPQRDERLGWTGDIQVFAPTANYLYDTAAFLGCWLRDVEADQRDAEGIVPIIVPSVPMPPEGRQNRPMAIWADCAVITPWDLYMSFGDQQHLKKQWESMKLWLDHGVPRDKDGFYATKTPQYGDWLDPRSPPALPGNCPTDNFMAANAYLIYVTDLAAQIATILGETAAAEAYASDAKRLLELFRAEYITPKGRLACDTQTAYALGLRFGLFEEKHLSTAKARLSFLTRWEAFKITTGFAGTPIILEVLADHGMLNLAYRMLQERDEPSWLYPVGMGATTIWERWNSMLPDGTINPGQMTSFNHYALGSVCAFLHKVVGGLSQTEPGWKTALVKPRPGGTIRHATTSFDSPYGLYEVSWKCEGKKMVTNVKVPPNCEARVVLPGVDEIVGSGEYLYETEWVEDSEWPPEHIPGPQGQAYEFCFVP
ncbi:Fc.00g034940.m01.CDS01 [Cosmosporella sp. VM-42]